MTLVLGHLNKLLSGYATKTATNKDTSLIGDILAPAIDVDFQSDSYVVFGAEEMRLDRATYKGGALVNRVTFGESDDSYKCKEFALESGITWSKMKNADQAIRLEKRHSVGLGAKMRLRREKQVADLLTGSGFTNSIALSGEDCWDLDTSNPVRDVVDAVAAIRDLGMPEPDTVEMNAAVWDVLKLHPDITSRVAGLVSGTPATKEQAATALGVRRVLVGSAMYNTAAEGATASYSPVWPNTVCVCYVDPNSGGDAEGLITPAQQFVWDGLFVPFSISTYESEETMEHVLRCYDCVDVKAIAVNALYRIRTPIS